MKRWLILTLCILVACGLMACSGRKNPPAQSQDEDVSTGTSVDDNSEEEIPNAGEFGDFFDSDEDDSSTTESAGDSQNSVTGDTTTTTTGTATGESPATTTTAPSDNEVNGGDWFGEDTTAGTTTTTTQKTTKATTTVAEPEQTKVGKVSLPSPGYDPDGKGRIVIGEVSYTKPMVSIEIKNVTTKWMTEETNYLEYTCYDKKGNVLTLNDELFGKIYMGALRAGKSVTKTFAIPTGTTRVEITGYSITYWTEWA